MLLRRVSIRYLIFYQLIAVFTKTALDLITTDEFCPSLQAGILNCKINQGFEHRDQFYLAIVVPFHLQRYILGLFQNSALSAHFSSKKMIYRLTSRFWWSGLATHCEEWSSSCLDSETRKSVTAAVGMPGLLPQALRPGDLVAIDFLVDIQH
jgi:hypothetical protein